jgi:hypothetical protein
MPEIVDPYDARPVRSCLGCGKNDKAPRDQVTLPDGNVAYYHWDCHVLVADCPVCKALLKALGTSEANDGVVDEELHKRLHEELNKQGDERAKIFTTIEAVAQPKPAGAK